MQIFLFTKNQRAILANLRNFFNKKPPMDFEQSRIWKIEKPTIVG